MYATSLPPFSSSSLFNYPCNPSRWLARSARADCRPVVVVVLEAAGEEQEADKVHAGVFVAEHPGVLSSRRRLGVVKGRGGNVDPAHAALFHGRGEATPTKVTKFTMNDTI